MLDSSFIYKLILDFLEDTKSSWFGFCSNGFIPSKAPMLPCDPTYGLELIDVAYSIHFDYASFFSF